MKRLLMILCCMSLQQCISDVLGADKETSFAQAVQQYELEMRTARETYMRQVRKLSEKMITRYEAEIEKESEAGNVNRALKLVDELKKIREIAKSPFGFRVPMAPPVVVDAYLRRVKEARNYARAELKRIDRSLQRASSSNERQTLKKKQIEMESLLTSETIPISLIVGEAGYFGAGKVIVEKVLDNRTVTVLHNKNRLELRNIETSSMKAGSTIQIPQRFWFMEYHRKGYETWVMRCYDDALMKRNIKAGKLELPR